MNSIDRFWSWVEKSESGCWNWTGKLNQDGYGRFMWYGKCQRSHRLSYELHRGKISPGLQIDHLCKNKACVRPDHLEPVTQLENMRRSNCASTVNAAKTACKYGHPFYQERPGRRRCTVCFRKTPREANP